MAVHVISQCALIRERSMTFVAMKWSFLCVHTRMMRQRVSLLEIFTTKCAEKSLFTRWTLAVAILSFVLNQIAAVIEARYADATEERFAVTQRQHVSVVMRAIYEGFIAVAALKCAAVFCVWLPDVDGQR